MSSFVKETLILMIKLYLICVVVAGILAFVNAVTLPIIAANDQKVFEESMKKVLPEASEFNEIKEIQFIPSESGVELESIYRSEAGYVVTTVCHEGYGGDIKVMVGINKENEVTNIEIMSMSETAGLGAKAGTSEFMSQYSGLKENIGVEKNNGGSPEKNTISAISGATVTSKAVTKAVNCAIEAAKQGGAVSE